MKIQFFKTFILPIFDYCLSLVIYFSKKAIQKFVNYYNICFANLLNFKATIDYWIDSEFNDFNDKLSEFGLFNIQHRILNKLFIYIYKIVNNDKSPKDLKDSLSLNSTLNKRYDLRNKNKYMISQLNYNNDLKNITFPDFFSKFINLMCIDSIKQNFINFQKFISYNFNNHYLNFVNNFSQFKLLYLLNWSLFRF